MLLNLLKIRKKRMKFLNLMNIMKLPGFYLIEDRKINNGHRLVIGIPPNSNFEELEKKRSGLESYFNALIEMEPIRFSNKVVMTIINKDIGQFEFAPVRPKCETDIYIGKKFDTDPFFINLLRDAQILIAGINGTGKSVLLTIIIANLNYYYKNCYDLFLLQTLKKDIDFLKDLPNVRINAYTIPETNEIMKKAIVEIQRRADLFAECRVKGIKQYNKVHDKKMRRRFYIFEEISMFMDDDPECAEIWDNLVKLVKTGREVGVHFIGITQRTTAANLGGNGELKSQLCRLTFRQSQKIDSMNVMDSELACSLKEQEIYYCGNQGTKLVKVPYIDEDMTIIKKYLPELRIYEENKEEVVVDEDTKFKETKTESKHVWKDEVKFEHTPLLTTIDEYLNKRNNPVVEDITPPEAVIKESVKKKSGRPRVRKGVEM